VRTVATLRYRCGACGNLTRFDVTLTRRTRSFHHYSLGGDLVVEDAEVLSETVEDVACRWCGTGRAVEVVVEVDGGAGTIDESAPEQEPGSPKELGD